MSRLLLAIALSMFATAASAEVWLENVPLPARLVHAPAYGLATVVWGATAKVERGRPVLFVYELHYGESGSRNIRLCTELGLHPGQKVFFAARSSGRHPGCGKGALYAAIDGSTGVLLPGYEEFVNSDTWLKLPPARIEDFGCRSVRPVTASVRTRRGSDTVELFGIPGAGTYVSHAELSACLKSLEVAQWR